MSNFFFLFFAQVKRQEKSTPFFFSLSSLSTHDRWHAIHKVECGEQSQQLTTLHHQVFTTRPTHLAQQFKRTGYKRDAETCKGKTEERKRKKRRE